jgi:hypothetical protein
LLVLVPLTRLARRARVNSGSVTSVGVEVIFLG